VLINDYIDENNTLSQRNTRLSSVSLRH